MQIGMPKRTGPWVLSMNVKHEPRCPACAEFLQPMATVFRHNWAFCARCVQGKWADSVVVTEVLEHDVMRTASVNVNGLCFYTPELSNGEAQTACEMYIDNGGTMVDIAEPISSATVLALTPAGAVAMQDMFAVRPIRTEADLRRDGTLPPIDGDPSSS